MGKTALIAWGGWEGHTPERSAGIARDMLVSQGLDVTLVNGTAAFADPELGRFDLIVPAITMANIAKEEVENLTKTIRAGTGLAGFHGLMCDAFRNETEYQFMTGGQWVAHPGNIIDYVVNVTRGDDPVMAGLTNFPYRSEQYYMHVDPSNEVLATTTFTDEHFEGIGGVVIPVVWKRKYGKGRVFYSALGHVADEFQSVPMRTIFERGMLWAAR
jgi:uncharacterized protein